MLLKTNRTILKLAEKSDFEELLNMFSIEDIFKYIKPTKTQEEHLQFLRLKLDQISNQTGFYWVVRTKEDNKFIGALNLTPIPNTTKIQIGWMIVPEFQKQGYAFETAKTVFEFTLNETDFNQIYGVFDKENIASEKILTKLGFTYSSSFQEGEKQVLEFVYNN